MNGASIKPSHSILLGRPFRKTSKVIINVYQRSPSVEFDGNVVSFNIFDEMKFLEEHLSLCSLE